MVCRGIVGGGGSGMGRGIGQYYWDSSARKSFGDH